MDKRRILPGAGDGRAGGSYPFLLSPVDGFAWGRMGRLQQFSAWVIAGLAVVDRHRSRCVLGAKDHPLRENAAGCRRAAGRGFQIARFYYLAIYGKEENRCPYGGGYQRRERAKDLPRFRWPVGGI